MTTVVRYPQSQPSPTSSNPTASSSNTNNMRPPLRHRVSNHANSPIPPSLIGSPLLQSPNSPFIRPPAISPTAPSSSSMHDALGLRDTVPLRSSGDRRGSVDSGMLGINTGTLQRRESRSGEPKSFPGRSLRAEVDSTSAPMPVSTPTRPPAPNRTPSYSRQLLQQPQTTRYSSPTTSIPIVHLPSSSSYNGSTPQGYRPPTGLHPPSTRHGT